MCCIKYDNSLVNHTFLFKILVFVLNIWYTNQTYMAEFAMFCKKYNIIWIML